MITRPIPSTGEALPVIGMGTWQTFDVAGSSAHPSLQKVLETMHNAGGRLIDSSPMYGNSEKVIGDITHNMAARDDFFYATKVWTTGKQEGIRQMESSFHKMKRTTIDLMQIHNLTDWKTHLPVLQQWKQSGKIRYTGVTHYTDSSHDNLEQVIRKEKTDFVQFNYSLLSRHAEKRLLPAAADSGVATIINRPFGEGAYFKKIAGKSLPSWASDYAINSWAAYFLKFIISHPAVTCVIPATASPEHALENFNAGEGALPDAAGRNKMIAWIEGL
ncbi:MAG TPA: aldo/keto reductase [Chitinophagaceae bacterium]|jgi:diketogulonate reductase-like aldo/keto reductase